MQAARWREAAGHVAGLPARDEFLIRGGHVMTMADGMEDLPDADIHVRDGTLVAIGRG